MELFRMDSRNVEILTFDELYERACFIAEGEKSKRIISTIVDDDDFPF
ncbi:MAG: hypothetical protein IPO64_06125 [Bacteroidetes bacterium]|nr:hypothetical protein [Bacteroidota bacterium]